MELKEEKKKKESSFEQSKWAVILSTLGIMVSLLIFYYQEGVIIRTYAYTEVSEKRLTDQLHVDSEVIEKFANLKDKKHSPKSRYISAVENAYGEPLDMEFLNIIVAEAIKENRFNFNWIILPFFLTIVSLIFLKFFIPKNNSLISEIKKLKEKLNEKKVEVDKLTELQNDLCLCNVKKPYKTLSDTPYSIDSINKDIGNYHQFYLFGIFADKWIGDPSSIEKFKIFLDKFRNRPNRAKGEDGKIKFLLTDPLHVNIKKVFREIKGAKKLEEYYENYRNLSKFYRDYHGIFECRVVTYFPIFRYRKINDETIVSDYKFNTTKIKKGEDRPHLVFEYQDKEKCGEDVSTGVDTIAPCCLAAAFDAYFDKCWYDEEEDEEKPNKDKTKDLLKYLEDTQEQYEKLTLQSTIN